MRGSSTSAPRIAAPKTVRAHRQAIVLACLLSGFCAPLAAQMAFLAASPISVGNNPFFIGGGKLKTIYNCWYNEDNTDLAIANWGSNSVSLEFGYSSLFTADWQAGPSPIAVDAYPVSLVFGDFNSDGAPDIAVTSNNYVGVILNDPASCTNFNSGAAYALSSGPHFSVVTADLDNDGNLDLAVTNAGNNTISVLLGNGNGTFRPAVAYAVGGNPSAIVAADFYGLGRPDLAVVNYNDNNVSILYGIGDGTFLLVRNVAVGIGPNNAAAADLNRDGKQDLVVSNYAGNTISVLLGNGNGTFVPAASTAAAGAAFIAIGDINFDEVPDVVVSNYNDNAVTIFQGNGDGSLQDGVGYSVGANPYSMVVGFFANAPAGQGIIVANRGGNTLSQLVNTTVAVCVNEIITGAGQNTKINTTFAHSLNIFAEDADGIRYDGRVTTFRLPSSGPSGTFAGGSLTALVTTAFGGIAESPQITANGIAGRYVATASVSVGYLPTQFSLTNLPADDVFAAGFE